MVGNKNDDEVVLLEKTKRKTWVQCQKRSSIMIRKTWVQMKLPFLCEKCGKYVARHGVDLQ